MQKKTIKQIDPIIFFQKLSPEEKNICFLYGSTKNGFEKTIAWNPAEKFTYKIGDKNKTIENFKAFATKNTKKGRKLIGYISYDISYELYGIKKIAKDDILLPDIYFLAFDNWIIFKNKRAEIHFKDKKFPNKVIEIDKRKITQNQQNKKTSVNSFQNFKKTITETQYKTAYNKIKHYIKEGDIYQINFSHRLEATTKILSQKLFQKIIESNHVDFLSYIEGDKFEILSGSPERFIKIKNRNIETYPIKGTRPRGETETKDKLLKKELLKSKKETAELNMITDLMRNDLGKICKIGTVKVKERKSINKCSKVWHTYSKITGEIDEKITPIEALLSMLPGGSITGCPKKRAIEIINELEPTTRSVYTGTIGYIDPTQDMDFNISIRTIIKKNDKV
jgi:para-aminobenzoate synthetase component 1